MLDLTGLQKQCDSPTQRWRFIPVLLALGVFLLAGASYHSDRFTVHHFKQTQSSSQPDSSSPLITQKEWSFSSRRFQQNKLDEKNYQWPPLGEFGTLTFDLLVFKDDYSTLAQNSLFPSTLFHSSHTPRAPPFSI